MSKGDIILVPFPFTDLSGHKVRPALVIHSINKGEDCIVAFISSVRRKRPSLFDIPIVPSLRNGIKIGSTIKLNKIATLQKSIAIGELGKLESSSINQVNIKLRKILKL